MTHLNIDLFKKLCMNLKLHKRIYVAYSGGLDSSVLLHLTKMFSESFSFIVRALHINHSYSFYSTDWVNFCKNQCEKLKIPIYIYTYRVIAKKLETENDFRRFRFKIFLKVIPKNSSLLLAHNRNDDIETVFFNFTRGCGVKGLSGIGEKKKLKQINLLRPLINIKKNQIFEYAIKNNIRYLIDKSNFDNKFSRNFIRNNIILKTQKRLKNFENSIYNCSKICNSFYNYIYFKVLIFFKLKSILYYILPVKYLLKIPKFLRNAVIKIWIQINYYKSPGKIDLIQIDKILTSNKSKKVILYIKPYVIIKTKNYLFMDKKNNDNNIYFVYFNKFNSDVKKNDNVEFLKKIYKINKRFFFL